MNLSEMLIAFNTNQRVIVKYRDRYGWIMQGVLLDTSDQGVMIDSLSNLVLYSHLVSWRVI